MKKETNIPNVKETFFRPSDDRTYPNYMALAQCICGIEIDGEIKYPISADKIMSVWGIKGEESTHKNVKIKSVSKMKRDNKDKYKKVICLNNNSVYESIKEAACSAGLTSSTSISFCCKGKRNYAGKINGEPARWMYYEDYLKINHKSNIEGNK